MNPTKIYQDAVRETPSTIAETIAAIKLAQDEELSWVEWNRNPQTIKFVGILHTKMRELVKAAMQANDGNISYSLLKEANVLDKVVNSVMINGKYEHPK